MGTAAFHQDERLLETPLVGPEGRIAVSAHIPLARYVSVVAAIAENVCNSRHPVGQVGFITRLTADRRREFPCHGAVAGDMVIRARQQHSARR